MKNVLELHKISDKLLYKLAKKEQGKGKQWLSNQLNISRPTLDKKLKDNSFSYEEIKRLETIGFL